MPQYVFCSEENLISQYEMVIQPFWQSSVVQGTLTGSAHISIAYAYVIQPNASNCVVISSGRIESFIKYKELIFDLYQNGYSVFIHDHRGQGLSGRMLTNPQIGYVEHFDEYVSDFKLFMEEVVSKHATHKPKLLCHSMGSAIGALAVLRYPDWFEKVVFSSPMFGIRPSLPKWLSNSLLHLHSTLGEKHGYFWGQKNYEAHSFSSNQLTHSEVRYQLFREEYDLAPQLQLGGVSGHWLDVAAQAMDKIEQDASLFPIPALVIQAGADQIVDNKRQIRVTDKMIGSERILIKDAKHELFAEQDEFRVSCLTAILDFFSR